MSKFLPMKKNVITLILFTLTLLNTRAQFTVSNPPVNLSITDIEYNAVLSEVVVAADAGVFFFDGSSWTETTDLNGLPLNDVKCVATSSTGDVVAGTIDGLAKWNGSYWNEHTLNAPNLSHLFPLFIFIREPIPFMVLIMENYYEKALHHKQPI